MIKLFFYSNCYFSMIFKSTTIHKSNFHFIQCKANLSILIFKCVIKCYFGKCACLLTHMRPISTYVDLILNRVEFKIMAYILSEKTVYHIAALKYTIAWCVNVIALSTDSIEIILNVTLRQKQRIEHLVVFSLIVIKSSDKSIMLLPK